MIIIHKLVRTTVVQYGFIVEIILIFIPYKIFSSLLNYQIESKRL